MTPMTGFLVLFLIALFPIKRVWGADTNSLRSPNVSANALFLYRNSNFAKEETDTTRNGMDLQEAELAFYSDVDPYSRLNMLLTVHPEYELNSTTNKVEQKWKIEPEELFAESEQVPGVTLKLGKFKAALGKYNVLHTHAYPMVDAPIVNANLLGDEGLNEMGLSAAILLPTSKWFSEVTLQYLRGEGENKEFNSATAGDGVGVVHFKNLFDLNDSSTIEGGLSYAQGANSLRGTTRVSGADLTLKWRPVEGGLYQSGILGVEYLERQLEQPGTANEIGRGMTAFAQYQFAERWSVLARSEVLEVKGADSTFNANALTNDITNKHSLGFVFKATEFSSYRLEYDRAHGPAKNDESNENKIYLQANFTIGAHPSHGY